MNCEHDMIVEFEESWFYLTETASGRVGLGNFCIFFVSVVIKQNNSC